MSRIELRASFSLAAIFALRMFGLFLVFPIFALHAHTLPDGQNAALVGLAMGIFGLTQACLQIVFGMASDRYGRKPVIVTGLLLFAVGAGVAAASTTVWGLLIGRAIQGAGAISAAITALLADTTREQHRTKAMALIGGSIGLSFALSLVLAPMLYLQIGMSGIFVVIAILALLAIPLVIWLAPNAPKVVTAPVSLLSVLRDRELMRLNWGVFVLHLSQVAMFMVVPSALIEMAEIPLTRHWEVYLPVVLLSFCLMLGMIVKAEKRGKMKAVFVAGIALLSLVQVGFATLPFSSLTLIVLLFAFFLGFHILEASLPSMVSRLAPASAKGAALGVYNTLQALGVGCGGALGGFLIQQWGARSVFILSAVLSLIWLIIAHRMAELPVRGRPNSVEKTE